MNLSIILYVHIDLINTIYQTLKVAFIFIENVTQYIFFSLNSSRSSPTLLPTQLHILSLSGGGKKTMESNLFGLTPPLLSMGPALRECLI